RLLHARLRRRRASLFEQESQSNGRGNSQGTERESLSLRDLCQRHSSGRQGRERGCLMADTYSWPTKDKATAIGKRVKRVDGMAKATGAAKYTYDVNLKNQLIAKGLGCPHGHCKIKSIDVAPALKVDGVVEAVPLKKSGDKGELQGDIIIVVGADS